MIRVLSVFGTRPEAIKMAPVVAELNRRSDVFDARVCVTAQHREMLDQVLEFFDIEPDVDLDIMRADQTLGQITSDVLGGLDPILAEMKPDLVLVHGDTTTTMAAAMASFYRRIAVGHVEAGLRTYDMYYPFPEEMNRVLADAISTLHFAPTETSLKNLLAAGVARDSVFVTGNTVIDALIAVADDPRLPDSPVPKSGRLILVTAHRRENFGAPLENACRALRDVADAHEDVRIVYPVHLNPNVQRVAYETLGGHERIHLLDPVAYPMLVRLMKDAYIVVTDSGGIQEEAPSLGKPVLVLRNETERPEAVDAGTVRIVGTDTAVVRSEIERLLTDRTAYAAMAEAANPYGDGRAAKRTADAIAQWFAVPGAGPFEPFSPAA
jgi:UDP-N-acetylglucosamine 2-epimerase (non-hydrolysing)